ncbi:MarR family transcriptional regulator [Chitinophaga sp. CB10]|uniref:MarR family winged helix-turn-helix transcriptional regulator n=1 Tax=Chitinophaga sp. CB10 TaxID=1891659 RepID=UPI000B0B1D3F|nr:MarR family transcriptional regulator [Chitinophaga sp. CB10]
MSNVINESGILAISTRLQRLADTLRKDGQLIYKAHGIEFEPKWFPVIYTLYYKETMSVMEIAAGIGYTHPSTISLLKELEKQKLIRSRKDKRDERKRLLTLSEKGQELVQQMLPVWKRMEKALTALTNTANNLMAAIEEVEAQMEVKGFYERERGIR